VAHEKILIVEDEGNTRTLLTVELERAGYQVFQAEDGDSGYQIAKSLQPDLIISDVLMPQMDGNQLMKKLRESEFGKNIPFIVISARDQMKDYFETMKVDDFIAKPYKIEDFLKRIDHVLVKYGKKSPTSDAGSDKKAKILILDNDSQGYEKFRKTFMDHKYEVEVVTTFPECLSHAVAFKPDIIALRFLIDQVNGDELVQSLKKVPEIRNIPVVVYSRKPRDLEESKVLEAGASCFVGEVTEEKLLEAVKKAVQ
jgi:DNA-binding response OmpR family regulator